jgi:bifunctional non-homologous end joining protein LigD
MPIAWDELGPAIGPAYFTVANAPARLANLAADPWADFRRAEAPLGGAGKPASGRSAASGKAGRTPARKRRKAA